VVRVLLVDDETIRELLQSYLQRTPLEWPSCAPWVPGRIFTFTLPVADGPAGTGGW